MIFTNNTPSLNLKQTFGKILKLLIDVTCSDFMDLVLKQKHDLPYSWNQA